MRTDSIRKNNRIIGIPEEEDGEREWRAYSN